MEEESLLATILLLAFLFATAAASSHSKPPSDDLASCLTSFEVSNFTTATFDCSPVFDALLYFSIQNLRFANDYPSSCKPLAIILPATKHQLRAAVLCCRRAGLTIRIRSGGHSYEGLSYVADTPFAIIDMMNLNRVEVDPPTRTAWVEAGATLGETYHAVAERSRGLMGFSGGSCPTVGSGGHIAGGGFGLLSRKHGLAADNVVDAVLIDPDGRFLTRESMGEDVFWAIRGGGGGCWGAVYAWRVRLVPVPNRVSSFIVNRPGSTRHVAGLVNTWQHVAHGLPDEFYLSAFVGSSLPESDRIGSFSATFKGFYLGPRSEAISIMSRWFPDLGLNESECVEMSWIESVLFFSGLPDGSTVADLKDRRLQGRTSFKAKSDYVKDPISAQDLEEIFEMLGSEPKAYLILDPYGGIMGRIKSDVLPFPHRAGNLYAIQHLIEWIDDDNGDGYMEWIRQFYEFMEPFVSKEPRSAYINYLDLDLGTTTSTMKGGNKYEVMEARTWGEKYFLGNYDRLVKAKTIIDPQNVFKNPQSIPPMVMAICSLGGKNDDDRQLFC